MEVDADGFDDLERRERGERRETRSRGEKRGWVLMGAAAAAGLGPLSIVLLDNEEAGSGTMM